MKLNKKFTVIEKREMQDTDMTITAWGNKSVTDRDLDLISSEPDTWELEDFSSNPVLLLSHDHNKPSVGRVLWTKEVPGDGGGIRFKAKFANTETGRELYQLYSEGAMNAFSVGFTVSDGFINTDKKVKDINGISPERVFTKVSLHEISCVNLPANQLALVDRNENGELKSKQLCDIACQIKKDMKIEEDKKGLDIDLGYLDFDIRKLFNEDGTFIEINKLSENAKKNIERIEFSNGNIEKVTFIDRCKKLEEIFNSFEEKQLPPEDEDEGKGLDEQKGILININVTDNEIGTESESSPEEGEDSDEDEKIEVTAEFIHVPVRDSSLFLQDSFRTIDISVDKGIKAVVGKLKANPGDGVVVQKYLFENSKFTEGEAQAWVEGHKSFTEELEEKNIIKKELCITLEDIAELMKKNEKEYIPPSFGLANVENKSFKAEKDGDDYIFVSVLKEDLFQQGSFRMINIPEDIGVSALVARLEKSDSDFVALDVQKFYFETEYFTDEEAVKWTESHSKVIKSFKEEDSIIQYSPVISTIDAQSGLQFLKENSEKISKMIEDNIETPQLFILDEADAIPDNIYNEIDKLMSNEKSNDFMHSICKSYKPESEHADKTTNKLLDVTEIPSIPATFNLDVFSKFLEVDVKDIFQNNYSIPNAMLGTQLAGFKAVLSDFELKDERNFNWDGTEYPLHYNVIKLNSKLSEEFLTSGTQFYSSDEGEVAIKFSPGWGGIDVDIYTSKGNSLLNKSILEKVDIWVEKNNHLKGEKFTVMGDFLSKSEIGFDDVILTQKNKKIVKQNINKLSKDSQSRGLMLVGPGGTGKTLTGKAIIKETENTFIWASSSDFKDLGSIAGLSLAFKLARTLAPTVLFIEDIDTWIRGYTVDLLKTEMDGLKSNKGVVTILTSNEPENFPDTLIDRPGRFHHVLSFAYPNGEQRKEMLEKWAKGADEDKIEEFVGMTKGFSGAHIKELVDYAKMLMEDEEITFGKALIKSLENILEQRELINAIKEGRNPEEKSLDIDIENIKDVSDEIEFDDDWDEVEKEIDIESIEIEKDEEINIDITKEEVSEMLELTMKKLLTPKVEEVKVEKKQKSITKEDIADLMELNLAKITGKII